MQVHGVDMASWFSPLAPPAWALPPVEEQTCPKASQTTVDASPAASMSEPQAIRAGAGKGI